MFPSDSQLICSENKTQERCPFLRTSNSPQVRKENTILTLVSGICSRTTSWTALLQGLREKTPPLRDGDAATHGQRDKPNHMENAFAALVGKCAKK